MAAKKVSQSEMRLMMQKLKGEKNDSQDRKRKYKLSAREEALLEMEKKRKLDEKMVQKKTVAQKAGVPENFFDSAKTKAFLNLGKAPQKSILKNSSKTPASSDNSSKTPAANSKAKGTEWTSSAPVLHKSAGPQPPPKEKSPQAKKLLRTPSGGTITHLEEEMGEASPKPVTETPATSQSGGKGDLPEGFFDDPVMDAKARGVEYKVQCDSNLLHVLMFASFMSYQDADELEWAAFQKEIAVEVAASADLTAVDQMEETVDRQLEEIDDQMRAWSRVRNIEIKKDDVDTRIRDKKQVREKVEVKTEDSDDEVNEEDLDEFLDWRQKKT